MKKTRKGKYENYFIIGALIIFALGLFYLNGGQLFSIGIEGGQTQFAVGQMVPLFWRFTTTEYDYLPNMGMTCDDLKGNYYLFISSNSGAYQYDAVGNRYGSVQGACTGYPVANSYYCTEIIPYNAVNACKSRLVSTGVMDFTPKYTGSYAVKVDFVSSTKNQIVFPYNTVVRQSSAFAVVSATPTPTPGTSTPTPTPIPTPSCPYGYYWVASSNTCYPNPTAVPTNTYNPTPIPTIQQQTPTPTLGSSNTPTPTPSTGGSTIGKCEFYEKKETTGKCGYDYAVIGVLSLIAVLIIFAIFLYNKK